MSVSAKAANQNAPGPARIGRFARRSRPHRRDQEFLPAALEILESPPSPVRLALMSTICALATTAIALAYVGHLDVVAVAQGKIQPTGRVKVVQPFETGRVRAIKAANGQHVAAGDILVELDPTEAEAEEAALRASFAAYEAEAVRRREAIHAVQAATPEVITFAPALPLAFASTVPPSIRAREARVLAGDLAQLEATLGSLSAQLLQKKAEQERLRETIAVQRSLVATLMERVNMRTILVAHEAGTKAGLIDATETLQYQQATLATQAGQLAEAEAGVEVLRQERRKTTQAFIAENDQKLADAERQADDLSQRLAKAVARTQHMTLRAPLAGTVQGSSLTTIGQVVMPSEEVMRLVPDGSELEIEAYIQNADIGFVHEGQAVAIKIESLPFTRYGTVEGRVTRVATDAIPEPDAQQTEASPAKAARSLGYAGGAQRTQNLVFPVLIHPQATRVAADGGEVLLSPGMAVAIEIKTGRRRILEYLFSPLVEVTSDALRER